MLAPGVTFAVVFQVFDRLIPMGNSRKAARRRATGGIPIVEDYRGTGGLIRERLHRNAAIRFPVIGSPREQRRVRRHEIDASLFTIGDADLMHNGIGFEINPDRAFHVLIAQDRSAE